MSSPYFPPVPRLRPLAEFGDDTRGYLEHVEQYREYLELKSQMELIKRNFVVQEPGPGLQISPTPGISHAPAPALTQPPAPANGPTTAPTTASNIAVSTSFSMTTPKSVKTENTPSTLFANDHSPPPTPPSHIPVSSESFTIPIKNTPSMHLPELTKPSFGMTHALHSQEISYAEYEHHVKIANPDAIVVDLLPIGHILDTKPKKKFQDENKSAHTIKKVVRQDTRDPIDARVEGKQEGEEGRATLQSDKTDLYPCTKCSKILTARNRLAAHMQSRHIVGGYCLRCLKFFSSQKYLHGHIKNVHSGLHFKCPKCLLGFKNKTILKNHLKACERLKERQNLKEMLVQKKIQKLIQKKQQKQLLKKLKQQKKERVCGFEECSYSCSRRKMKEHKLVAHKGLNVFGCNKCDMAFPKSSTLMLHKHRIHNNLVFHCRGEDSISMGCGKMFRRSDSLKSHMKTCERCGEGKAWEDLSHSQKLNRAREELARARGGAKV